ncbi:unnamed protein product [Blepharisma stoltei]|uniref:Uncharacterized protein n=1 Tax=Blepharisma stoltei TaxID=1481888 RepID=A0AAU9IST2_9CILI|nr:unnamed protein product [Blepharisma stoltei]
MNISAFSAQLQKITLLFLKKSKQLHASKFRNSKLNLNIKLVRRSIKFSGMLNMDFFYYKCLYDSGNQNFDSKAISI